MRFPTMWYVPLPVKLLIEHNSGFFSITGGCTGSSEYTLAKLPHYWKTHVAAHVPYARVLLVYWPEVADHVDMTINREY